MQKYFLAYLCIVKKQIEMYTKLYINIVVTIILIFFFRSNVQTCKLNIMLTFQNNKTMK